MRWHIVHLRRKIVSVSTVVEEGDGALRPTQHNSSTETCWSTAY